MIPSIITTVSRPTSLRRFVQQPARGRRARDAAPDQRQRLERDMQLAIALAPVVAGRGRYGLRVNGLHTGLNQNGALSKNGS